MLLSSVRKYKTINDEPIFASFASVVFALGAPHSWMRKKDGGNNGDEIVYHKC